MGILIVLAIGCITGFALFRRNVLPKREESYLGEEKVSIIIPGRLVLTYTNRQGIKVILTGKAGKARRSDDSVEM